MKYKLILPALALVLALLACRVQVKPTNPPFSPITVTDTPTLPSLPPTPTSSASELSLDSLRNATYDITDFTGTPRTVTLVNGGYASGSDPLAADYLTVNIGNLVAFGDLNYDGVNDAAVILGINTGGTGVFTYIAAVLNISSTPVHAASVFIDDRPMINSLIISSGEILSQTVIHASDDAMCCPALPMEQGFRLYNSNQLVLTRKAGQIAGGFPRAINVNLPADLAEVSYPFTISGSVTVGPFENTLAYAAYTSDNTLVTNGPVMTDSPNPGDPGDFSQIVDLSMAGVYGLVRFEFSELSMKDGSVITLDSVLVNVH
jgi:hypothetical protein